MMKTYQEKQSANMNGMLMNKVKRIRREHILAGKSNAFTRWDNIMSASLDDTRKYLIDKYAISKEESAEASISDGFVRIT